MKITIPDMSLVVLIGASGSGKSTFAAKNFLPTEVLSSDFCRGLVSDDENNQSVTADAFEVLHFLAGKRLDLGKIAVVDATSVQEASRKSLVALAKAHDSLPVAIVFNMPERVCLENNARRTDRQVPEHAIRNHCRMLRSSLRNLKREGFRQIYVLNTPEEAREAEIERQPLWNNRRGDHGPFDVIGDVHGCFDELELLLRQLGYSLDRQEDGHFAVSHPEGRRLVFLGDLCDRGPKSPDVLRLVMDAVGSGAALCVPGNHDAKLLRYLNGRDVQITHGLAETVAQLAGLPPAFREEVKGFLDGLVSHYVLDDGKLVVAHAGMKQGYQGRGSGRVREFALYGETTGETDEYGLPVRHEWAREYRGRALVVYGHTPQAEPLSLNNTINIDTGCVFGGNLTAYRYPEGETVSVPALRTHYEPARPFLPASEETLPAREDDLPDIGDVLGKRLIQTRLKRDVTIREENAAAALEVMSRFAADPRWLIYMPPTMSPCETSPLPDILEHPREAFAYYRNRGVASVVCEQKHMGSRAVVIVCRDADAARSRFGVVNCSSGIVYTRTGRRFFDDPQMEEAFLNSVRATLLASGFFADFQTDWVCLDCELMPWSAKAQALLQNQYAPVGAAAGLSLREAVDALLLASGLAHDAPEVSSVTSGQNANVAALLEQFARREESVRGYVKAYREYCWPVRSLADLKLAPFHILATEGAIRMDKNHLWHMETIARYCAGEGSLMMATPHLCVDVTDEQSVEAGVRWWTELTAAGGEGMVVKPLDFIARGAQGLLQPAVKCRGYEYLRIIYGPEYTLPHNIERLKSRSLGRKRSLALREFALGAESLERFVRREPFYRVHECVFGVLALESEPVDPRL